MTWAVDPAFRRYFRNALLPESNQRWQINSVLQMIGVAPIKQATYAQQYALRTALCRLIPLPRTNVFNHNCTRFVRSRPGARCIHQSLPSSICLGSQRRCLSFTVMATAAGGGGSGGGMQGQRQAPVHSNRLAREQSPYLLQHAHNPVDWFPWGEEAFAKAQAENKPLFLSVGYSTCYWCHVMERESFENDDIAALLNESFIAVKVDREERPDVDRVYMQYVQATQGGGGWPMNVFLTPQLQPFFGGTYYPPKDMYGRPGFPTVLRRVSAEWQKRGPIIEEQSRDTMRQLQEALQPQGSSASALGESLAQEAVDGCAAALSARFDPVRGGFGGAPKFPRPSEINLLLAQRRRLALLGRSQEAARMLHMAAFSLSKMAAGGMYDHLGGGFHRYSVDEHWHVPHFEKMTYDNPQLASTYLAAYQVTGDPVFAFTARGVLDYLLRDMTHPEGAGLCAAEDAESTDPATGQRKEGFFYVWKELDIRQLLGPQRSQLFCSHYMVKPGGGNCNLSHRSDPHGEFKGYNVLMQARSVKRTAEEAGMDADTADAMLAECREMLFKERLKRPKPHRDDKVVAAWNGMAISALATAGRALAAQVPPPARRFPAEGRQAREYLDAAEQVAEFVLDKLWQEGEEGHAAAGGAGEEADIGSSGGGGSGGGSGGGRSGGCGGHLVRCYTRGPSPVHGFADDYALMVQGLLDLYGATGCTRWLGWAVRLQRRMDELFWDQQAGGYFNSPGGDASILLRLKEDYDGAEPAASSIAAGNLLRLAAVAPREAEIEAQQAAREAGLGEVVAGEAVGGGGGSGGGGGGEGVGQGEVVMEAACALRSRAERCSAAFAERLEEVPLAMPQMCCGLEMQLEGHLRQVIVAGRLGSPDMEAMLDALHAEYVPDKAVIVLDLDDPSGCLAWWGRHNPEVLRVVEATGMTAQDPATAFICQNFTCRAPTHDPARVGQLLSEPKRRVGSGQKPQPVDVSQLLGKQQQQRERES